SPRRAPDRSARPAGPARARAPPGWRGFAMPGPTRVPGPRGTPPRRAPRAAADAAPRDRSRAGACSRPGPAGRPLRGAPAWPAQRAGGPGARRRGGRGGGRARLMAPRARGADLVERRAQRARGPAAELAPERGQAFLLGPLADARQAPARHGPAVHLEHAPVAQRDPLGRRPFAPEHLAHTALERFPVRRTELAHQALEGDVAKSRPAGPPAHDRHPTPLDV